MAKVLRPSTIIPPALYVERAADRQLHQIINDMGRPGYVLVARQMGKTNLLLNMKRRRESQGDVVVYVDLTNRFDSERGLFRHIIDALAEAGGSPLDAVADEIRVQRDSRILQANVEYDRHLRQLLRTLPTKKFIVVLDEIDSLINVQYSDIIFAQIRSMYFSRANHPEYERLTYVLSGVAEPTDLIKDRNISPFNIGEKIYLDDFSQDEFRLLTARAGLVLTDEVAQELYSWTAGNPRMTWDLCSELEDIGIGGRAATASDVRTAIDKLYLTRFDRAPVDHIRALAESDPELRNAIASIRWGKSDTLDEKAKSRLYLAGISGVVTGAPPEIKNRILDEALSDVWLDQVAARQRGALQVASEHFAARRYRDAIRLISEFEIPEGKTLPTESAIELGMSKYFVGDYSGAIAQLRQVLDRQLEPEMKVFCENYFASSLLRQGRAEESLPYFRRIAEGNSAHRHAAMIAIGSALLTLGPEGNFDELLAVNTGLIAELGRSGDVASSNRAELLTGAHYNIAQAYQLANDREQAKAYLEKSLETASPTVVPAILLKKVSLYPEESRIWVAAAAEAITSAGLRPEEGPTSGLALTESILASILGTALALKEDRLFEQLFEYTHAKIFDSKIHRFELLLRLFGVAASPAERSIFARMLQIALDRYFDDEVDRSRADDALRNLALSAPPDLREAAMQRFLQRIPERLRQGSTFVDEDLLAVANLAATRIRNRQYQQALDTIPISRSVLDTLSSPPDLFVALALYQEMLARRGLSDRQNAKNIAAQILEKIRPNVGGEYAEALDTIRTEASNYLGSMQTDPYRRIGRNQWVTVRKPETGELVTKKFKTVEVQLRSGEYSLVRVEGVSPSRDR